MEEDTKEEKKVEKKEKMNEIVPAVKSETAQVDGEMEKWSFLGNLTNILEIYPSIYLFIFLSIYQFICRICLSIY